MIDAVGRRAALALAAAPLARPALAQGAWPSRPIRLIVPFPPGGSNDVVARPLADRLQPLLGQPVVIENRGGAGGAIGAAAVSQAAPDGYTLMVTSSSFATSSIIQRTPYKMPEDFTPVAVLAKAPFFILVSPDFPARDVAGLIAAARANPGGIDYASSGPGGINHFITEYFCLRAGIRMNHVPYRGTAQAVTDLVAGHVQVLITTVASANAVAREGRVRVLAYTAPGRNEQSPAAPLVREMGLDYEVDIWWGLFGPKGLPEPIVTRLNAAANAAVMEGGVARIFEAEGARPAPGTPGDFSALLDVEMARWRDVARAADIRVE
ncbi:Bug family tripartite tricarboxylate transporter substrate binding protein [Plastoroseomonas arctica]|uniref:Tripartite tricarboxylate transporter substrate binding protein n=1 Tax=Plastoroseomonas arctica TaxID=1509237 RepID=A0AAF1KN98_9PROT|nr:tripartite tricarboxylate transporter substrate-binding protein [Plastoroseomonas arctica]MBR0657311.1 tripartite tricarboxylate transporter substrate binding protein [Plastoroseomonas arctica]